MTSTYRGPRPASGPRTPSGPGLRRIANTRTSNELTANPPGRDANLTIPVPSQEESPAPCRCRHLRQTQLASSSPARSSPAIAARHHSRSQPLAGALNRHSPACHTRRHRGTRYDRRDRRRHAITVTHGNRGKNACSASPLADRICVHCICLSSCGHCAQITHSGALPSPGDPFSRTVARRTSLIARTGRQLRHRLVATGWSRNMAAWDSSRLCPLVMFRGRTGRGAGGWPVAAEVAVR
jgi:hypothetical protein